MHTQDGGATWSRQESGTRRWLYCVSFAGAQSGWAVGDDGLILRTTDSGENWIVQISNLPSNLLGVQALSERRAVAVGLNGIILRTSDGGRTWLRDVSGTTTPLRAIASSGDGLWTVGRDGLILRYAGAGPGQLRTIFPRK